MNDKNRLPVAAVKSKKSFSDYWSKYSTVIIMVLMIAVFGVLQPQAFMTGKNLIKIIEQSSITILLACGEFFAILLGGIDLSVGSTMRRRCTGAQT